MFPRRFGNQLKELKRSGLPLDAALAKLRSEGASIMECIVAVKDESGCDLGEAKQLVSSSRTWRDVVEATEKMWDELIDQLEEPEDQLRQIEIARAELTADSSRALISALNAELSAMYSEPGANHFGLRSEEVSGNRGAFLVVSVDGMPVGCGAVRLIDADTGELKRMYMAPSARGKGLGRKLVAALEAEARALGAKRLVLETGIRQLAALALYRGAGFREIPLYGEYCLSPNTSVCLGKEL